MRHVVTFTVEYETEFSPLNSDEIDYAVEAMLDVAPGTFSICPGDREESSYFEAVGWKVEHPDWGDMAVGSLMTAPIGVTVNPSDNSVQGQL